jgi:hypothetical protein
LRIRVSIGRLGHRFGTGGDVARTMLHQEAVDALGNRLAAGYGECGTMSPPFPPRPAAIRPPVKRAQANVEIPGLFPGPALKVEIVHPCLAIVVGNGDTVPMQFAERHLRSVLRQAHGRFQTILKELRHHVGHPLAAGMVQQRPVSGRRVRNDHDIAAFHLQAIDGSELVTIVQEKNILPHDRARLVLPWAFRGEVSRVLHKPIHMILHNDLRSWEPLTCADQNNNTTKQEWHLLIDINMNVVG